MQEVRMPPEPSRHSVDATTEEALRILCIECQRPWLDPGQRWRAYTADDENTKPEVGFYCPTCGERCFDDP
jgi:RNase P subunit RPR2